MNGGMVIFALCMTNCAMIEKKKKKIMRPYSAGQKNRLRFLLLLWHFFHDLNIIIINIIMIPVFKLCSVQHVIKIMFVSSKKNLV